MKNEKRLREKLKSSILSHLHTPGPLHEVGVLDGLSVPSPGVKVGFR